VYRVFLASRWFAARPIGKVTMIGIWLSSMATIVTVAVMTGFLRDHERFARGSAADVSIVPLATAGDDGAVIEAANFAAIEEAIAGVAGIATTSPRLVRPALVRVDRLPAALLGERRYSERNFARVVGVDREREVKSPGFQGNLVRPDDPEFPGGDVDDPSRPFTIDSRRLPAAYRNARLPVVLFGARLFDWCGLRKGELVNLVTIPERVTPGEDPKPLSERFVVGGAVRTGNEEWDLTTLYLDLGRAKTFFRARNDVTEVAIEAMSGDDVEALESELESRLAAAGIPARVETWRERSGRILDAVENERKLIGVLLFFFLAVACFNVFSTLTILVSEKTRDIGVLNALGAPRRGILTIFLGNGLAMAILAGALGVGSGLLLASKLDAINEWIGATFGFHIFSQRIFVFRNMPVEISPRFAMITFAATIGISLLCAWRPARRAADFDPVEALRHE
jgi:lipoprotein-releasing system permease protein